MTTYPVLVVQSPNYRFFTTFSYSDCQKMWTQTYTDIMSHDRKTSVFPIPGFMRFTMLIHISNVKYVNDGQRLA